MLVYFIVIVVVWLLSLMILVAPKNYFAEWFDRLSSARWAKDREILELMLDHLKGFPDQWSISRKSVHFPKEGAKQIMLTHDNGRWNYHLSSFDGGFRPLEGHYHHEFATAIRAENNEREKRALLRNFYGDGPLLLS